MKKNLIRIIPALLLTFFAFFLFSCSSIEDNETSQEKDTLTLKLTPSSYNGRTTAVPDSVDWTGYVFAAQFYKDNAECGLICISEISMTPVFTFKNFVKPVEETYTLKIFGCSSSYNFSGKTLAQIQSDCIVMAETPVNIPANTRNITLDDDSIVFFLNSASQELNPGTGSVNLSVKVSDECRYVKITGTIASKLASDPKKIPVSNQIAVLSGTGIAPGVYDIDIFPFKEAADNTSYHVSVKIYVYKSATTDRWITEENAGNKNLLDISDFNQRVFYCIGEQQDTDWYKKNFPSFSIFDEEYTPDGSLRYPFKDLDSAIEKIKAINDGTTEYILYTSGTLKCKIYFDRNLNLTVTGLGEKTVLDRYSYSYLINLNAFISLKMNNLIFSNGYDINGGAVSVYSGAVSFTDCIFKNNQADTNGGAIFCTSDGTVTLENCVVGDDTDSNNARRGGGIYVEGGTVTLINTVVFNNYTYAMYEDDFREGHGSGIYVNEGTLILKNGSVVKNNYTDSEKSGFYGDGIFNYNGTVELCDTSYVDSTNDIGLYRSASNPGITPKIKVDSILYCSGDAGLIKIPDFETYFSSSEGITVLEGNAVSTSNKKFGIWKRPVEESSLPVGNNKSFSYYINSEGKVKRTGVFADVSFPKIVKFIPDASSVVISQDSGKLSFVVKYENDTACNCSSSSIELCQNETGIGGVYKNVSSDSSMAELDYSVITSGVLPCGIYQLKMTATVENIVYTDICNFTILSE